MAIPVPSAFVQLLDANRRTISRVLVTDATGMVTFLDIQSPSPLPFNGFIRVNDSLLPDRFTVRERSVLFTGNDTFIVTVTVAALPIAEPEVPEEEVAPVVPPVQPPIFPGAAQDVPTRVAIEPLKSLYSENEDVVVRVFVVRIDAQSAIPNVPVDVFVDGNFALRTSTGVGFTDVNLGPLGAGVHEISGRFGGLAIELVQG